MDDWSRTQNPEIYPHVYGQLIFKSSQGASVREKVFSIKRSWEKTTYSYGGKKTTLTLNLCHTYTLTQNESPKCYYYCYYHYIFMFKLEKKVTNYVECFPLVPPDTHCIFLWLSSLTIWTYRIYVWVSMPSRSDWILKMGNHSKKSEGRKQVEIEVFNLAVFLLGCLGMATPLNWRLLFLPRLLIL